MYKIKKTDDPSIHNSRLYVYDRSQDCRIQPVHVQELCPQIQPCEALQHFLCSQLLGQGYSRHVMHTSSTRVFLSAYPSRWPSLAYFLVRNSAVLSTFYHPITNGLIKRFHRTLWAAIKSHNKQNLLTIVLLATMVKEDIGCQK